MRRCISNLFEGKKSDVSFQVIAMSSLLLQAHEAKHELRVWFYHILGDRLRMIRRSLKSCRSENRMQWLSSFLKEMAELSLCIKRCGTLFPSLLLQPDLLFNEVCTSDILEDEKVFSKLKASLICFFGSNEQDKNMLSCVYEIISLMKCTFSGNFMEQVVKMVVAEALLGKYDTSGRQALQDHTVNEYFLWVERTTEEEVNRWSSPGSRNAEDGIILSIQQYIRHALTTALINPFKGHLIYHSTGFMALVSANMLEELNFFIHSYVQHCGTEDLETALLKSMMYDVQSNFFLLHCDPARVVERTLEILNTAAGLFALLGKCAPEEEIVSELNKKGFEEAVSAYYDRMVKNMEMEDSMIATIQRLDKLVQNKEAFDTALRNSMLVRLTEAKENNIAAEHYFLAGLREERRGPFDQLLSDVERGWELSRKFQKIMEEEEETEEEEKSHSEKQVVPFKFIATILRGSSVFPLVEQVSSPCCMIPEGMKICERQFLSFYGRLHNGRRLRFLYRWGEVRYHLHHQNSTYRIIAPTSLAFLIEFFNSDETFPLASLCERCGVPASVLEQQLRLLLQKGLILEEEKKYKFNNSFFSSRQALVLHRHDPVNDDDTLQARVSSRLMYGLQGEHQKRQGSAVEAVVMQVVKSSSPIKDKALFENVSASIHQFSLRKLMIKDAISKLIERGYIRRSSEGYFFQP